MFSNCIATLKFYSFILAIWVLTGFDPSAFGIISLFFIGSMVSAYYADYISGPYTEPATVGYDLMDGIDHGDGPVEYDDKPPRIPEGATYPIRWLPALQRSVEKWDIIAAGDFAYDEGSDNCGLCIQMHADETSCSRCPLGEFHTRCTDHDSLYNKFYDVETTAERKQVAEQLRDVIVEIRDTLKYVDDGIPCAEENEPWEQIARQHNLFPLKVDTNE